jgi:predicted ATPase
MKTAIIVENFKSIGTRESLEIRPLTLLAGANSSGKSSVLQSLLLLKQTLESTFDPGPLRLDGPHVKFTSAKQFLHKRVGSHAASTTTIGLSLAGLGAFTTSIAFDSNIPALKVARCEYAAGANPPLVLTPESTVDDLSDVAPPPQESDMTISIHPDRFWLVAEALVKFPGTGSAAPYFRSLIPMQFYGVTDRIEKLFHVPGLRGSPRREYPVAAVGEKLVGTFDDYVASILHHWTEVEAVELQTLQRQLQQLGLTSVVEARKVNEAAIEVRVGRLPGESSHAEFNLVSIADVGFGVSQVLPVLVATLRARRDQMVYIEQPELHLHPRAQVALAGILADAARRGVLVIAETHSSLLLLAIQTLVAKGELPASEVMLHWFQRDAETGATTISSRELDKAGRFGDWPGDFGDVELKAESEFLDAGMAALAGG